MPVRVLVTPELCPNFRTFSPSLITEECRKLLKELQKTSEIPNELHFEMLMSRERIKVTYQGNRTTVSIEPFLLKLLEAKLELDGEGENVEAWLTREMFSLGLRELPKDTTLSDVARFVIMSKVVDKALLAEVDLKIVR